MAGIGARSVTRRGRVDVCGDRFLDRPNRTGKGFARCARRSRAFRKSCPEVHNRLRLEPLTPELRQKGFHECNPHDPLGLGPYAPYERLSLGRALIPQKGGHTSDMGFDVLIHFHGGEAVRKALVQVTRGLTLVMVDLGMGGGGYSKMLGAPSTFPHLLMSIENALKRKTGDSRAHIRHLALSSWSAGSVAINKIMEQDHTGSTR